MKYLWFLLVDVPLSLLRVLVAVAGLLMVAIALLFAKGNHLPKWASWWDNPTYGIKGNKAYLTNKDYNPLLKYAGKFPSNWYWLAIRNPANGLVQSKLFSVSQAECDEVNHIGKADIDNGKYGWQFVWARKGWRYYTGFYCMYNYSKRFDFECRIGFKVLPLYPERVRRIGMTSIINPFKGSA